MTSLNPPLTSFRPRKTLTMLGVLTLFILPLAAGCSQEQSSGGGSSAAPASTPAGTGAVIAKVNGVEIREGDLALAEEDLGADLARLPPDQKREQVIAYLTDIILVSRAPEGKKVGDSPDFQRRIAFMRNKLLMGALLSDVGQTGTTEEAMRKVYDEAVKTMSNEEEVRARHILVETQEEANEIVTQLRAGADFAAMAKEKSKDPGSADGGDLGYFTKDQMVPEFANVAFQMFPGQLSNPIKTQFGWHIIKLEDKRQKQAPTYEQVKSQLETFVARKTQTDYVAKLRETAKIERLDKPATPAAPPAQAPAKK